MNAAVLAGPRAFRVETVRDPAAGPGEALVRVGAAGICGTDYRIWTGERRVGYPLIPGHEFIGEVVAVGPAWTRVAPGDRVAVEPNWGCGACDLCRDGSGNLCLARTAVGIDRDGGFAELAVLPERACWAAPAGARLGRAALRRAAGGRGAGGRTGGARGPARSRRRRRRRHARACSPSSSCGRAAAGCWPWAARRAGSGWPGISGADATVAGAGEASWRRRAASPGRDGVDLVVETAGTAEAVELAAGSGRLRPTRRPRRS